MPRVQRPRTPGNRESAPYLFHFTHPCEGEHGKTLEEVKNLCRQWAKYWIFQQERGEEGGENGYLHWQGIMSLKKRMLGDAAPGAFQRAGPFKPQYIAPMRVEEGEELPNSVEDLKNSYATKIQTRVAGPWDSSQIEAMPLPECYNIKDRLNLLQRDILEQWKELQPRDVLFVHGERGCCGKSTLAQYMARTMPNIILVPPTMASSEDMIQWICDMIPYGREDGEWTVVMDIPRGLRGEESWRKWMSTIEMVAGGWVYDKRYHGQQRYTKPIKAIVFSNERPLGNHLTWDRFLSIDTDDYIKHLPVYRVNRKRKWNPDTRAIEYVD